MQPPHSRLTKKMWNLYKPLAKKENPTELLNQLHQTASCILCLSSTTAVVLGEGMAAAVVAQCQWRLALTGLREAHRKEFSHQQVKLFLLFGEAVDKVSTCCNQTKKAGGGIMDAFCLLC